VLNAPTRQHVAFILGAIDLRNLDNVCDAERFQLAAVETTHVRVRDPPAAKFALDSAGRTGKDRDTSRHATPHQVGRFQQTGTAGIDCHDYDIGLVDGWLISNKYLGGPLKNLNSCRGNHQQRDDCDGSHSKNEKDPTASHVASPHDRRATSVSRHGVKAVHSVPGQPLASTFISVRDGFLPNAAFDNPDASSI